MANRPGIRDRARLALRTFRHGMPPARIVPQKAAPFAWPEHVRGRPQWRMLNFENYVTEGFYQNPLIYRAIMYKAYAKALAPLRAYVGDMNEPEPAPLDHPLSQLVMRPNPYQSAQEFEDLNIAYIHLAGDCFIWMIRPNTEGLPDEMYTLRPDRVSVVPDPRTEKALLGYWYVPEGRPRHEGTPIRYQDMMHTKFVNPGDRLEGLGEGFAPLGAGAMSADVDNEATRYLKDFFERGLMHNVVLSFDSPIDDDEIAEIRDRWSEIYGGRDGWLKPGVLGEGGRVERLSQTANEMGFEVLDERNESRILAPFGVPAILVGARVGLENATYSNAEGLRKMFWEDVFVPELTRFEQDYQYHLQSEDGAWVAYDYSRVPALTQNVVALVDAAIKQFGAGVPINMAFSNVGLNFESVPGGDISYLPSTMIPAGSSVPVADSVQPGGGVEAPFTDEEGSDMPSAEEEERDEKVMFWEERALLAQDNGSGRGAPPPHGHARSSEDVIEMLVCIDDEFHSALDEKRSLDWDDVMNAWVDAIDGPLYETDLVLVAIAKSEGWSAERMKRMVEMLPVKAHVPIDVPARCPLCDSVGADLYEDHGGLMVCRSCDKTFDPELER